MAITIEDLKKDLRSISEAEGVTALVYALLKDGQLKKLDIENEALGGIKTLFIKQIYDDILSDKDKHLISLSSADERGNVIYQYDLELPEDFNCVYEVSDPSKEKTIFNISEDKIEHIHALIVEIGNETEQIVLYKTIAPVNVFRQKSFMLGAIKANHRFTKLDTDLLRISPNFQFMKTKSGFFVMELKTLEKWFGFHTIIKNEATKSCAVIEELSLLENPETLIELIEDVTFARKLVKIHKASPVLRLAIPNSDIISFCQNYPQIKGRIKTNVNGDKLLLDTNVSKELFIKILMDDYLTSQLTKLHYDTLAKNEFDNSPEENLEVSITA